MPLFSIITVTFNPTAEDLQRTVESISAQDFEDWELIIKDGGSEAGTLDSVPNDPRIRITVQEDTGIFDAMNQSIDVASGKLVCFLNAGDTFFDSAALQSVADAYENHSGKDFFYGNVAKPKSRSGFELYSKRLSRAFLFMGMVCHQAWFVRRSYYESTERFETIGPAGPNPSGSDYRFLLRMVLIDQVAYHHVPQVLVSYQGGGYSVQPDVLKTSNLWKNEQRKVVYTPIERIVFQVFLNIRTVAKKLLYDRFVWRIWRKVKGSQIAVR